MPATETGLDIDVRVGSTFVVIEIDGFRFPLTPTDARALATALTARAAESEIKDIL